MARTARRNRRPPAPAWVAPAGSTIPEPDREPAVDETVRADLIALSKPSTTPPRPSFANTCVALRLPNIKSHRFTRAHGALLARLITEAGQPDEPVPDHLHDDAPESNGYDDDEPGRPY